MIFSRRGYEEMRELLGMEPLPYCADDAHELADQQRTKAFVEVQQCIKCQVYRVRLDPTPNPGEAWLLGYQWLSPASFEKLREGLPPSDGSGDEAGRVRTPEPW